jgi:hypothetical protein
MKKFLPVIISLSLFLPAVAAAQGVEELPQLELIGTLETIANLVFTILIAISLIFLVYAGILFVTAAGSAEQVEKARHIILYAIIGLVVAALAWGIREFLRSQLGF